MSVGAIPKEHVGSEIRCVQSMTSESAVASMSKTENQHCRKLDRLA